MDSPDREDFLNNILGCSEMTESLRQISALRRLQLVLREGDPVHFSEQWWNSEVASRLQKHLAVAARLSVMRVILESTCFRFFAIHQIYSSSKCNNDVDSRFLWCTRTEYVEVISRERENRAAFDLLPGTAWL